MPAIPVSVRLRPVRRLRAGAGESSPRPATVDAAAGASPCDGGRRAVVSRPDRQGVTRPASELADAEPFFARAGACALILAFLLLPTGWPVVWMAQLIEVLR